MDFSFSDLKFIDITLSQAFNTYGLFEDYGTGSNTPRGNPCDLGRANGRKRKRWSSRKLVQNGACSG